MRRGRARRGRGPRGRRHRRARVRPRTVDPYWGARLSTYPAPRLTHFFTRFDRGWNKKGPSKNGRAEDAGLPAGVSRSPWQARDAPTREAVVMRDMVAGDHLHVMKLEDWPLSVNRNPRERRVG